jgi:hypothetical protein
VPYLGSDPSEDRLGLYIVSVSVHSKKLRGSYVNGITGRKAFGAVWKSMQNEDML